VVSRWAVTYMKLVQIQDHQMSDSKCVKGFLFKRSYLSRHVISAITQVAVTLNTK